MGRYLQPRFLSQLASLNNQVLTKYVLQGLARLAGNGMAVRAMMVVMAIALKALNPSKAQAYLK